MCYPAVPYIIAGVAAAAGGYQQYQQGKYEKGVSEYNAATTKNDAQQVRNKGTEAENAQRERMRQMISAQRVEAAANNININTGSIGQIQEDTASLGEADALRIRNNTDLNVNALNQSAELELSRGKNAEKSGKRAFQISLLSAAGSMFSAGGSTKPATSTAGLTATTTAAPSGGAPIRSSQPTMNANARNASGGTRWR